MKDVQTIFGTREEVIFPDWNLKTVAKIDTGAYSGALHVEDLRVEKSKGKDELVFRPLNSASQEVHTTDFKIHKVKNTSGITSPRYTIPIRLVIAGQTYHTRIGLTDRTNMTFPIIVGRKLLNEHHIVVDVKRNDHLRPPKGAH